MDQESTAMVLAAVSGAGAMLAALAAFRSAGTARAVLKRSEALEHRRAVSDVVEMAQRVVAEHERLSDMLSALGDEVGTYAMLTGNRKSSWYEGKSRELSTLRAEIDPLRELAEEHLNNQTQLRQLSEDELSDLSSQLSGPLRS
jgi:hypothetical protein